MTVASMGSTPETRQSLLVRLKDSQDQASWYEFTEIYRPVVFRLARRKGMQDADADDLAQQVLASVAGAIERWESDPKRARFRTWLHRVAHNAIINALTRRAPDRGSGDTGLHKLIGDQATAGGPDSDLLRLEFRREQFHWAAKQIRPEFQASTWQAFWLTAVENEPIDEISERLGKSNGSIYAARSRVMRRLKEKLGELDVDSDVETK